MQSGCGSCHRLADAGTSGTTGPDLDETLAGRSEAFIGTSILEPDAVIADDISAGVMPSNYGGRLSDDDLDALIDYLAETAG